MKKDRWVCFLLFVFCVFFSGRAFADSCPCCGRVYGEAAPGDQARVYELRRQHEAECCAGRGGGNVGAQAAGLADAFNWGMQMGQVMLQQMQQNMINQANQLNNQGLDYERNLDYDSAVRCFQQALNMNPHPTIRDNLLRAQGELAVKKAQDYEVAGEWDKAIEAYKEALSYDNNSDYRAYLKSAYEYKAKDQPRLTHLREVGKAKSKVDDALDDLAEQVDKTKKSSATVKTDPGIGFAGAKQDLKKVEAGKMPVAEGSIYPECKDNPMDCKVRTELILDALQENKNNWEASVIALEKDAQSRGGATPPYQQAISYLEGFQYYEKWALEAYQAKKPMSVKELQDTSGTSSALLEAISGASKNTWLGPKRPTSSLIGGEAPGVENPDNWKLRRIRVVYEALDKNKDDVGLASRHLEKKVATNPKDLDSVNALNFLRGYGGYLDFVKEQKAKK